MRFVLVSHETQITEDINYYSNGESTAERGKFYPESVVMRLAFKVLQHNCVLEALVCVFTNSVIIIHDTKMCKRKFWAAQSRK